MSNSEAQDSQLEQILAEAFLAQSEGKQLDLQALCEGDANLVARAKSLMARSQSIGELASTILGQEKVADDALTSIGDFKILRLLGSGGMGRVFLAREVSLDRLVALKIIRKDADAGEQLTLRFKREAELAASLEHPAIVPIYTVGESEDHCVIAMKWLSGPSLHELVKPVPAKRVAEIGMALASALEVAHRSGVIHRDVKPANVILDDNSPILVDFGLARSYSSPELTSASAVPGTLAYLAPEKLRPNQRALDPRSDLYSVGATLFELLTGAPPFTDEDPDRLIRTIVLQDAQVPREASAPVDLETILLRCLAKEPHRRFETAQALADDLERFLKGAEIHSKPVSKLSRIARKIGRYPKTFTTIAVLSMALLVFVGLLLSAYKDRQSAKARQLSNIESAIAQKRLPEATRQLGELRREFPGDPEVRAQLREFEYTEALERLQDLVQDRAALNDIDRLRRLAENVRQLRTDASSSVERFTALALSSLIQKDMPAVRRHLDQASKLVGPDKSPRFDLKVLALLAQGEVPETLDVPADASADEVINVVTAMRHCGADSKLVKQLIEHALAPKSNHLRARVALGVHYADQRKNETALAVFLSLSTSSVCRNLIYQNRARLYLLRGDPERTLAELDSIPANERNSHAVILAVNALERLKRPEAAEKALREAVSRWPSDSEVRLKLAATYIRDQRLDDAHALCMAVAESSGYAPTRDSARLLALTIAIAQTVGTLNVTQRMRLTREQREELLGIAERIEAVETSTHSPIVRARALAGLAWLSFLSGKCVNAITQYTQAIALHPGVATYSVNALATFIVWDQLKPGSDAVTAHRAAAVGIATTLTTPSTENELPATRSQRANAHLFLADHAYRNQQWRESEREATQALKALGDESHPSIRSRAESYIKFARQQAKNQ